MMQENELTMMAKALDEKEKTIHFLKEKLDIKAGDYDQLVQNKNLLFSELEKYKVEAHQRSTDLQSDYNCKMQEEQRKHKDYENRNIYLEEQLEKFKMNTGIQLSNQKLE